MASSFTICSSDNAIASTILMVFFIRFEDLLLMVSVYIHCIHLFVFYGGKKSNKTWNNIIFGQSFVISSILKDTIGCVCTVLQVSFYFNCISLFFN